MTKVIIKSDTLKIVSFLGGNINTIIHLNIYKRNVQHACEYIVSVDYPYKTRGKKCAYALVSLGLNN